MSLISQLKRLCRSLAKRGWSPLFECHGFDLGATDIARELKKTAEGRSVMAQSSGAFQYRKSAFPCVCLRAKWMFSGAVDRFPALLDTSAK